MIDEEKTLNRIKKLIEEGKTEDATMIIRERIRNNEKPHFCFKYFYYLAEIHEQEKNFTSAFKQIEESKNQIDLLIQRNYSFNLEEIILCTNCYIKLTRHYLRRNMIKDSGQCLELAKEFYEKVNDKDKTLKEKNEIELLFKQINDQAK